MAGDTNYQSVALLLHCDGADGSTTFTDSSPSPKTVTAYGDAKISTARSKFGGASGLFDGSGDYLIVGGTADFKFLHDDSTDYSIEGCCYWTGGAMTILSTSVGPADIGAYLGIQVTTGYLSMQIYRGAAGNSLSAVSSTGVTLNSWTYFKVTYTKTTRAYTFRVGSAGAGSGSMTVAGTWPASSTSNQTYALAIGRSQTASPGGYFNGNIDELRISKMIRTETSEPTAAFYDFAGQVSGTVKDSAGAPCARTVRAYRRDTGALLSGTVSDPSTGAYLFAMPTLDEVNIVAYDDAAGSFENDQIIRVVPA